MEKVKNKTALLRKNGKYYALGISIILVIAFIHFGLQMFFIQKENRRSFETATEIAPIEKTDESLPVSIEQPAEPKTEVKTEIYKVAKISKNTTAGVVKPKFRQQEETVIPARIAVKKKIVRETRTERLRRAEQILTGV